MSTPVPRSAVKRLLFSLLPLAGLVAGWEVIARVLDVAECRPIEPDAGQWPEMMGDAELLWRLRPSFTRPGLRPNEVVRTNTLGVRDQDMPGPKHRRERRIVLLGDSTVFGWGVADGETWADYLKQELQAQLAPLQITVINLGVPGYSSLQSLRLMDEVGWQYEPDVLIVASLFSDASIDTFQDATALALTAPVGSDLLHRSRTYCGLYMTWAEHYAATQGGHNQVLMPGIIRHEEWLAQADAVRDRARVPPDQYQESLRRFVDEAEEHDAEVVFAVLAHEWDIGQWTTHSSPPPQEGQTLPWALHRAVMAAQAAALSVPLISFPEVFAGARDHSGLFQDPVHPTAAGMKLMARATAEVLLENREALNLHSSAPRPAPPQRTAPGAEQP